MFPSFSCARLWFLKAAVGLFRETSQNNLEVFSTRLELSEIIFVDKDVDFAGFCTKGVINVSILKSLFAGIFYCTERGNDVSLERVFSSPGFLFSRKETAVMVCPTPRTKENNLSGRFSSGQQSSIGGFQNRSRQGQGEQRNSCIEGTRVMNPRDFASRRKTRQGRPVAGWGVPRVPTPNGSSVSSSTRSPDPDRTGRPVGLQSIPR